MRHNKAQVIDLLNDMEIAPLELDRFEPEMQIRVRPVYEIRWENKAFRFNTEVMTVANPKSIVHAIWQLQKNRPMEDPVAPTDLHPLIVAPYLSDRVMEMLLEQRVSGLDLSGNVQLIVPDQLFFSRLGRPNRFPSSDPIKNVYRWSSSVVPRVFFSKARYSSVSDLHFEIRVRGGHISMGTVSKVLKTMEDDLLISRGHGISLIDGDGLLQKLADSFAVRSERRMRGRVSSVSDFAARIAANCAKAGIVYCVDQPQRYAISPVAEKMIRIYVENAQIALTETGFQPDEEFANVEIIETSDPAIFFDRRIEGGSHFTSPIQSYLALRNKTDQDPTVEDQLRVELLANVHGQY